MVLELINTAIEKLVDLYTTEYNELAKNLGVKMIHINDIDLQEVKDDFKEDCLINPWCIDSFWFEMLSESTFNVGTHEIIDYKEKSNLYNIDKGYFEFKELAVDNKCRTYYPGGYFEGHMVPHEETITISKFLEVLYCGCHISRCYNRCYE